MNAEGDEDALYKINVISFSPFILIKYIECNDFDEFMLVCWGYVFVLFARMAFTLNFLLYDAIYQILVHFICCAFQVQ